MKAQIAFRCRRMELNSVARPPSMFLRVEWRSESFWVFVGVVAFVGSWWLPSVLLVVLDSRSGAILARFCGKGKSRFRGVPAAHRTHNTLFPQAAISRPKNSAKILPPGP